jgi:ThiF family
MARQTHITANSKFSVIARMAAPEFGELRKLVFRRYPALEWATFARFGWRETAEGLVVTLASIDIPNPGDLDESVGHVSFQEPYTLRAALAAEQHPLAIGVVHSHPAGCIPRPSWIDDDMDEYYASYFRDFAPGRPYISLIFSEVDRELAISGRLFWHGEWRHVNHFAIECRPTRPWIAGIRPVENEVPRNRTARLNAAFGDEGAVRLRRSTVAIIGAGGTGSAAIEVLARAGVGRLIIVDPDHVDDSNLERIHGSRPDDSRRNEAKVSLAKAHVQSIDPDCEVLALFGALPQKEVVDAVVTADVALGCTDQQHSRLALSDISVRYLVPSLDCGVLLEGSQGDVTGQIIQLTRFLAADPCALCRGLVLPNRLAQELIDPEERERRRAASAAAVEQGMDGDAYWRDVPQLNTVGYLTTTAGAMAAGYAIGWLSRRFDPPFERLQLNLGGKFVDATNSEEVPRADCVCRRVRGWADQASGDAMITSPSHWPAVKVL